MGGAILQDGLLFEAKFSKVVKMYDVGNWVLVTAGEVVSSLCSVVGKVVCETERLIVIRSKIGG